MAQPNRCLLISGGAARGAVAVYPMGQLAKRHGYDAYGAVAGVSVGALCATKFAQHDVDGLDRIWRTVDGARWFQRVEPFRIAKGLYSLDPLREQITVEVERGGGLKSFRMDLFHGVTDLEAERYWNVPHNLHPTVSSLVSAIVASCAQPAIHHVERCLVASGGVRRTCADGGVIHVVPAVPPPPIGTKAWAAVDAILCSEVDRRNRMAPKEVDGALEAGGRAVEMWNDRTVTADIARLREYAKATGAEVTLYAPPEDPREPFDADPETIKWRLDVLGPKAWGNATRLA